MRWLGVATLIGAGCFGSARGYVGVARDDQAAIVHAGVVAGLGFGGVDEHGAGAITVGGGMVGSGDGKGAALAADWYRAGAVGRRHIGVRVGALTTIGEDTPFRRFHAAALVRLGNHNSNELWAIGLEGQVGWFKRGGERSGAAGVALTFEYWGGDLIDFFDNDDDEDGPEANED